MLAELYLHRRPPRVAPIRETIEADLYKSERASVCLFSRAGAKIAERVDAGRAATCNLLCASAKS